MPMIGRIRVHTVVRYVVVSKKFGDKFSSKATIVYGAIFIVIGPEILSWESSDDKRQIQTFSMA